MVQDPEAETRDSTGEGVTNPEAIERGPSQQRRRQRRGRGGRGRSRPRNPSASRGTGNSVQRESSGGRREGGGQGRSSRPALLSQHRGGRGRASNRSGRARGARPHIQERLLRNDNHRERGGRSRAQGRTQHPTGARGQGRGRSRGQRTSQNMARGTTTHAIDGRQGHRCSRQARRRRRQRNAAVFHDFFLEGNIGHTLFPRIRAYLSVQDLVVCGKTGYTLQRDGMCDIYTVQGMLSGLSRQRHMRLQIGNAVRTQVKKYSQEKERPKRVTLDQDSNTFFRANLYHPDELPLITAIIHQFVTAQPPVEAKQRYSVNDGSFRGFFNIGYVGHTIFPTIREFLDVSDLAAFRDAGLHQEYDLYEFFTISDVLEERNHAGTIIGRDDRIRIGAEAAQLATPYKGRKTCRPHRVIEGLGDRWRWDYLHHPKEYSLVCGLIDFCLKVLRCANAFHDVSQQMNGDLAFSASFGTGRNGADVTLRLALLARRTNGILVLQAPPPITDSRGVRRYCSSTFHHWCTRYLGDPVPFQTKVLTIRYVRSGTHDVHVKVCAENRPLRVDLRDRFV